MVLHLSTFHLEGGAGVAATRLHRALLRSGSDSGMLVPAVQHEENGVYGLANTKWQARKAWMRFVAERAFFLPYEKDKSVRFAFSPAAIGADIRMHPLVQQADIIHLHWINFGFLSLHSLEKLFSLGKPIVWTLHDMWTFTGGCHYSKGCENFLSHCRYCPFLARPEAYDLSFAQFERKRSMYGNARMALVSPSQWLDDIVKSAALTKNIHAQSIPNCIDTGLFTSLDKSEIRARLNLPLDKKLVLFAGANTQDPRKGFSYFKDAVAKLNRNSTEIEVLVLGKSRPENFTGFPANVHYLGKISDQQELVNAYNAADIIAVPSLEDNLPNTIMEAMACGTPVAGFSTGGIPEMIDHKVNGYVSEAGSSDSLAEGMQWIMDNNTGYSLSRLAREKVIRSYAENVIARRYQELYQSLLAQ
ncbi:glycosyltransferase [Dyadobacter flavalbus]|uniref:Glycosyltransferase n=1 Tax=Dyadobacter flavalbus TaxID=2579942 RepID=A0A5M8Q4T4_9BACT|nr:glycosyltransferase family 4 protein [Dyadobacter flavalbus]KAA6430373.1 glycosyltransferase [Dyadobacter flavalbus]